MKKQALFLIAFLVLATGCLQMKNEELDFHSGECNRSIDPYDQALLGVQEDYWEQGKYVIKAYASVSCAQEISAGDYSLCGDRLELYYQLEGEGASDCRCVHELTYEFRGMEKKNYSLFLARNISSRVNVSVDKKEYGQGENVSIEIENQLSEDILVGTESGCRGQAFSIEKTEKGSWNSKEVVCGGCEALILQEVENDSTRELSWNQKIFTEKEDCDSETEVSTGIYRIKINFRTKQSGDQAQTVSNRFRIK